MIRNIEMITNTIQDFSYADIKYLTAFYLGYSSEISDHKAHLEIDFVIEDKNNKDNRILAKFRFRHPKQVYLDSDGTYHQIHLDIEDITDRGWENSRYKVLDYEEGTLSFYCSSVEVISVIATDYEI
ncbi:hypothetical protein P4679_24070 [Priestia megaterium]|uniref:hypothetical protein n=1 Tax=Priestia megaterium TaxID=1404 RepID=UPI002E1DA363|nr:hypothetical protein [Priestia megaterium]